MIFYEYNFINHLCQELQIINDLENEHDRLKYFSKKRILLTTLKECKKYEEKKENCYAFNIQNKIQWINEDEFWEKWNQNLIKIIEGEL